jgi:hypothetical protein
MDMTQFWQLIDRTRGGDIKKHAERLTEELAQFPEEEIVEYQRIFDTLVNRAERYDIVEVADFIYGGLGDDGWKDFRAWLIGQGQAVYENMLADPESLVDVVGTLERLNITAELLSYAACRAFERKTGRENFYEYIGAPLLDDEPVSKVESLWKGVNTFEEYEQRFQEKYPRVWAKFSDWDPTLV